MADQSHRHRSNSRIGSFGADERISRDQVLGCFDEFIGVERLTEELLQFVLKPSLPDDWPNVF